MRKVLYILGELSDGDIDWMASVGSQTEVMRDDTLIHEGKAIDSIYVVLDGKLGVHVGSQAHPVALLGRGEIVGEMSLIDKRPPSATVRAMSTSRVLRVPRSEIEAKFAEDLGFSARFHRALSVFLSDRLRSTVGQLGYGKPLSLDEDQEDEDELDLGVLEKVSLAGARFDLLLQRLSGH
ncbi:DNA-binding transcriptional dual regulator Crp [compost metagenome]